MRIRKLAVGVALALSSALVLAACGGGGSSSSKTITVGSANFSESEVVAQIYAEALKAKGVHVDTKLDIGDREAYLKGMADGSINLVPEYTGNLLLFYDKNAKLGGSAEVYAALQKALPAKLEVLDYAPGQDKDSVTVTKATAQKYHLTSIADLKPVASQLVLGGPPEWTSPSRPGVPMLKAKYGLTFERFQKLDEAGPVTVAALKKGTVQAANLFSTDPSIKQDGFVTLTDPLNMFGSQNVVPLIAKDVASKTVADTLNAVSKKLTTQALIDVNTEVQVDKQNPDSVAKKWLAANGLS